MVVKCQYIQLQELKIGNSLNMPYNPKHSGVCRKAGTSQIRGAIFSNLGPLMPGKDLVFMESEASAVHRAATTHARIQN